MGLLPLIGLGEICDAVGVHETTRGSIQFVRKVGEIQETGRQQCTLSHPLINMTNWLLNLDEPPNAKMLLTSMP